MKKFFVLIIVLLFLLLSAAFWIMRTAAPEYNFAVLMTGNITMALLSIITFYMVNAQVNKRPEAFVRGVYSSSFLKLLVCMAAILVYVLVNRPNVHKPSLFMLFGIYAVYSIVETWMLSRLAREK
jgi:hypothetical protein